MMDMHCVALLFLTSPVTHHPTMHGAMEILVYYFEKYLPSITIFLSIRYNTLHPDFPAFFAAVLVVARLETKCSWEPVSCYQHTSAQSSVGRGAVNISCS